MVNYSSSRRKPNTDGREDLKQLSGCQTKMPVRSFLDVLLGDLVKQIVSAAKERSS